MLIEGSLSRLAKKLVRIKSINPVTFRKLKGAVGENARSAKRRIIEFDGVPIGQIDWHYQGYSEHLQRHRYYINWFALYAGKKNSGLGTHALSTFLGDKKIIKRPARVRLEASAQDFHSIKDMQKELEKFYKRVGFRIYSDSDWHTRIGIIDID